MRVLFIGNCQVETFAKCADLLVNDIQFEAHELSAHDNDLEAAVGEYSHIYAQLNAYERLSDGIKARKDIRLFPRLGFSGFHPDNVRIRYQDQRALAPTGPYHSALIFAGWYYGLSEENTAALFSEDTAERLDWRSFFRASIQALTQEGDKTGIDLKSHIEEWMQATEPFMLTFNHPSVEPIMSVAKSVLQRDGYDVVDHGHQPEHNLLQLTVMPVYPEVAKPHGMTGSFSFKRDSRAAGGAAVYGLEEFISRSFPIYSAWDRGFIDPQVMRMVEKFSGVCGDTKARPRQRTNIRHPYSGIPSHQKWPKAFGGKPLEAIDPVVTGEFRLTESDKVATAGSCFAQHIARALDRSGLNYYVPESGAAEFGYGVYSCRYGNIYTTAQLRQMIDRAYGDFEPVDVAWQSADHLWADPFRPEMPLERRDSASAIIDQREEHFSYVRTMFERMDYFVFTLGLTEAWRSKHDGAVFPIAPGVAAGEIDFDRYEFVNFGIDEVRADLNASIDRIRVINPSAKIILTVSPVPLMATYEPRHVLVSTTYSKSVLRTAAEDAATKEGVFYFPSYEIITGNFNRGAYYAEDLRQVRSEGVDHVMRLFLKHCTVTDTLDVDRDMIRQIEDQNNVLCAEDMLAG